MGCKIVPTTHSQTLHIVFSRRLKWFRPLYEIHKDITEPGNGLFGWLSATWAVSDHEIETKRGLDQIAYLVTLKYLFWICVGYLFYGFVILVPTHSTAGGGLTGISLIGMGNVPAGSVFLTADLIGVFFNSVFAFALLYRLYRAITHLRIRSKRRTTRPENFVVMIREIPSTSTVLGLRNVFEKCFPGQVQHVELGHHTPGLVKHLKEREKMGMKVEEMQAFMIKKGHPKQIRHISPRSCCSPKEDGQDFYKQKFDAESAIVQEKQQRALNNNEAQYAVGVAFVTFRSIQAATMASMLPVTEQSFKNPIEKRYIVDPASHPESIEWNQLHVTHYKRFLRCILVNIVTLLLIFLWMIPVAFASSLATLSNLSVLLPFLLPILSVSGPIKAFIEGFLPGLVLVIFFAILVELIITPLARAEGNYDTNSVERSIFNKYYLFLLLNIFLGSIFASGVFSVLPQIISHPEQIPGLLAYTLPRQVTYFISYVMILSFSGFALSLLQARAILKYVFAMMFAKTKRAKRRALERASFVHYSASNARHCLVFILVSCYSTLNPLIVPFGCIYYGLAYIAERHNIIFVYPFTQPLEARYFPSVFTRLVWSLIVFQLAVAGILGLREFPAAVAIFVLFIATLLFWFWSDKQLHTYFKYGILCVTERLHYNVEEDPTVCPAGDTYQFPATRTPLFQLEDQSHDEANSPDLLWWPITFEKLDAIPHYIYSADNNIPN